MQSQPSKEGLNNFRKGDFMLIYEQLKKDHQLIKKLLNQLVALSDDDHEQRDRLVSQISDELIPHARAEESVLYNSLRMLDMAKDMAMHGYKEHMEAEGYLRTLQAQSKLVGDWKKTAMKLKESLEHHIEEEEGKIFSMSRQLFTQQEAEMMCEAFIELKPNSRDQGMMKNTMDLVANLMPPRFTSSLRTPPPN